MTAFLMPAIAMNDRAIVQSVSLRRSQRFRTRGTPYATGSSQSCSTTRRNAAINATTERQTVHASAAEGRPLEASRGLVTAVLFMRRRLRDQERWGAPRQVG